MTIKLTQLELNQILANVNDQQFKNLNKYVMFLGHAHSGHSIIGSIIDSHSEAAIANEANIPKQIVDFKLSKSEINKLTLYCSMSKSEKNWTNTGYKYNIPNSFQGQCSEPRVLGDKKGGGSIRIIRNHPWVFDQLIQTYQHQLSIIHVKRNTLDNIAAFAHYWDEPLNEKHVIRYFENLETIMACQKLMPDEQWLSMSHDHFINDLDSSLQQLFDFVELDLSNQHKLNIKSIVRSTSHSRRDTLKWPENVVNLIEQYQDKLNKLN